MAIRLTQAEADMLIDMLKKFVEKRVLEFPSTKGKLSFDVIGERRTDEFVVSIDRKGLNALGCTYQGRLKSNNLILLRLDINPTAIHKNPSSGEKIHGSHLHIYTEEHDIREAIPFDTEEKNMYELCFVFFERFHVVEPPTLTY